MMKKIIVMMFIFWALSSCFTNVEVKNNSSIKEKVETNEKQNVKEINWNKKVNITNNDNNSLKILKIKKDIKNCNTLESDIKIKKCKNKKVSKLVIKQKDASYCNMLEEIDKEMCLEEYSRMLEEEKMIEDEIPKKQNKIMKN